VKIDELSRGRNKWSPLPGSGNESDEVDADLSMLSGALLSSSDLAVSTALSV